MLCLTRQVTVKESTHGGAGASLLSHHLDGRLALADSLWTAAQVCLATVPSADEALCNLGTFAFVASHLFSASQRHSSVVTELLRLIARLEEVHTEVQGVIYSPRLSQDTSFRCVAAVEPVP